MIVIVVSDEEEQGGTRSGTGRDNSNEPGTDKGREDTIGGFESKNAGLSLSTEITDSVPPIRRVKNFGCRRNTSNGPS